MYGLLAVLLLAAQMIDFDMTSDEKRQTGIYKLSDKEKSQLQNWIDNHYVKRDQPVNNTPAEKGILQENLKSGSMIRLSDGSLWSIHPKDTPVTQSWITPVEIFVSPGTDPDYPYKLTNSLTGSSVRAKKAQ